MREPNDFYLRAFTFWFDTEKALFQVILGLLLLSISARISILLLLLLSTVKKTQSLLVHPWKVHLNSLEDIPKTESSIT